MFTSLCYNVSITLWVFSVPHMRKTSPLMSPNTGPGAVKMSRIQVPFGPFVRIRFHCRKQKSLQRYYSGNGLTHRVDTYTLGGRNGVQARPPWNTPWTLQISLTRKLLPLRPLKLPLRRPYNCRLGITKLHQGCCLFLHSGVRGSALETSSWRNPSPSPRDLAHQLDRGWPLLQCVFQILTQVHLTGWD